MTSKRLHIDGMTCDHCEVTLKKALGAAGASAVRADHRSGTATLDAEGLGEREPEQAVSGAGYRLERVEDLGSQSEVREPAKPLRGDGEGGDADYDLVVIGSGSAAFAAAIVAREQGRTVAVVERGTTGGTCVNVGCVPSKALLADSEDGRPLREAVARKDELVGTLRRQKYVELLDEYEIVFRDGEARLVDPHTVAVNGDALTGGAVLLAAGASPAVPSITGLVEAGYLTSDTAIGVTEPPERLAVIGANSIGLELGQVFRNFGSEVTFLDIAERIAPFEEPEISDAMRSILEQAGHGIVTQAEVSEVAVAGFEKVLRGSVAGEPLEVRADEILVATGRRPNTEGLGLEEVGVETDARGAVVVDQRQRTSVPSIYAAGDVTPQPQFVYVAAAGGAAAARNALGAGEETLDLDSMPRVTFTRPQIASAGLTEAQARGRGLDVEAGVLELDAVPRALVNGDTRGLFKLVADGESRRLVGASVLADGAGEVIQSAVFAIKRRMTIEEIASTWAPYLTMAEGLKLAAQTFSRDVSKLSCCAA